MKNKQEHTPGPWIVDCETRGEWIITDQQDKTCLGGGGDQAEIARVYGTKQNEANAALIAAAPDLLAALKMALNQLDALENGGGHIVAKLLPPSTTGAYADIRAAIAKATEGK